MAVAEAPPPTKKPPAPSVPNDGSAVKEVLSDWLREKAAKRAGKKRTR